MSNEVPNVVGHFVCQIFSFCYINGYIILQMNLNLNNLNNYNNLNSLNNYSNSELSKLNRLLLSYRLLRSDIVPLHLELNTFLFFPTGEWRLVRHDYL